MPRAVPPHRAEIPAVEDKVAQVTRIAGSLRGAGSVSSPSARHRSPKWSRSRSSRIGTSPETFKARRDVPLRPPRHVSLPGAIAGTQAPADVRKAIAEHLETADVEVGAGQRLCSGRPRGWSHFIRAVGQADRIEPPREPRDRRGRQCVGTLRPNATRPRSIGGSSGRLRHARARSRRGLAAPGLDRGRTRRRSSRGKRQRPRAVGGLCKGLRQARADPRRSLLRPGCRAPGGSGRRAPTVRNPRQSALP